MSRHKVRIRVFHLEQRLPLIVDDDGRDTGVGLGPLMIMRVLERAGYFHTDGKQDRGLAQHREDQRGHADQWCGWQLWLTAS